MCMIESGLSRLIERGGVYYDIAGGNAGEALADLVGRLPVFPNLDKEVLLRAVLEREALMSTGIGKGIALPHPRTPLLKETDEPFAALAFTSRPVDWSAPDGNKVHAIFLIVSKSVKQHLNALSKINFLCREEKIMSLLDARSPKDEIIAALREAEAEWEGAK
ncbi:MAG TPA: PTS sugar transporter subunit IIA [Treponema sp.]|nr:PTS sugar transporter subunit IIA [Treponema sp.]